MTPTPADHLECPGSSATVTVQPSGNLQRNPTTPRRLLSHVCEACEFRVNVVGQVNHPNGAAEITLARHARDGVEMGRAS